MAVHAASVLWSKAVSLRSGVVILLASHISSNVAKGMDLGLFIEGSKQEKRVSKFVL